MSYSIGVFGKRGGPTSETTAIADMNEALRLYGTGAYRDALTLADRLIEAGQEISLSWRF